MYCPPPCHEEYRDGFTTCAECGGVLVEHIEAEEEKVYSPEFYEPIDEIEEVLLATTDNIVEFSFITQSLDDAEIPYRTMEPSYGQYMRMIYGINLFGINIYINKDDTDTAIKIVESFEVNCIEEATIETEFEENHGEEESIDSQFNLLSGWIRFARTVCKVYIWGKIGLMVLTGTI